jgi:hypothetical protein
MSTYPVVYQQTPELERNRLTVFFRYFMCIPHAIVSFFFGIGAFVVVFLAWFAILFTGRYPVGMYNFVAGYVRFTARYNAYSYLVTDVFPPFDGAEHPEYPAMVRLSPTPQESYSRLTTFFRTILMIPVFILTYIFTIWMAIVAIGIWFVAVFTGKSPTFVDALRFPMTYLLRGTAYGMLLTDKWPPLEG